MAATASHDASTPDRQPPPGLPEIQDEAADTPLWVPALGLGLFVLVALGLVLSSAFEDMEAAEAPAVEAAPAAAPAEPAAEPAAH